MRAREQHARRRRRRLSWLGERRAGGSPPTCAPKPRSRAALPLAPRPAARRASRRRARRTARRARLGPKPGRCMTEISPLGILRPQLAAAGMSPVSSSA
jgi:hypothetical protein